MVNEIRLHAFIPCTNSLGPHKRAAIWLQGCPRSCKGCMSPKSRPLDGGKLISIRKLADEVKKLSGIEGITVSGGEPFFQGEALYEFLKIINEETDLGVIIYTGYVFETLKRMDSFYVSTIINDFADLIIDGEYVDDLNDGRSLVGSSNQNLIFLTDRYKAYEKLYLSKERKVEMYIRENEVFMVGVPNKEMLNSFSEMKGT